MTVLKTGRLTLTPFIQDHARDVESYSGRWEVARYTSSIPHPYPPGAAVQFARDVEQSRRNGYGGHVFAIQLAGAMKVVGLIDLNLTDDEHEAELGYALSPDVWGRGYASEAARAVVDHGFETLGLGTVVSRALVENPASCRVLQKTGLRRIGNGTLYMPARRRTGLFEEYRMLRREWRS